MGGWLFWCRFWGVAKTFSKTPRVVAFFGLKTPRVVAFLWPKMARAVPPPPGCCLALLRGCAVRALRVRGGWLRRGAAWARVWTRRVLRVLDFGQRSCRCSCAWARSMFRPSCESCAQRAVRARAAFLNFGFCKMFFAKLTGVGGAQVRGAEHGPEIKRSFRISTKPKQRLPRVFRGQKIFERRLMGVFFKF